MSRTLIPILYPGNDLSFSVTLTEIDPVTGAETNLTSGTVTGFLATSNTSSATAADPSFTLTCNYSGTGGDWTITSFAGSSVKAAALVAAFSSATPYAIIEKASGIRVYIELEFAPSRAALIIE